MTQIVPAIDIIGGRCVRLSQGDFSREKSYAESPAAMAAKFIGAGVKRIHAVDLDGARSGHPENLDVLRELSACGASDIEWGGGIKTDQDVEAALNAGASHLVCSTVAVKNPEMFARWLETYGPERIILGADVRGTEVAVSGWMENSGTDIFALVESFIPQLRELIVTDISKDGMMRGPAAELYSKLMETFPDVTLTASGGVGSMEDIKALDRAGVPRVIVGKAIYEGKISLEEIRQWSQRG